MPTVVLLLPTIAKVSREQRPHPALLQTIPSPISSAAGSSFAWLPFSVLLGAEIPVGDIARGLRLGSALLGSSLGLDPRRNASGIPGKV